jgi:hypothetical protein
MNKENETLDNHENGNDFIADVMPRIGQRYSIIENGKRIFGTVESYQGDTGKFWVKWDDLEITLEEKCDAAL